MLQEVYLDLFNSLWHECIIKAYESDTGWNIGYCWVNVLRAPSENLVVDSQEC